MSYFSIVLEIKKETDYIRLSVVFFVGFIAPQGYRTLIRVLSKKRDFMCHISFSIFQVIIYFFTNRKQWQCPSCSISFL